MGADNITKDSTMQEILEAFPGPRRALQSVSHRRMQQLRVPADGDAGGGLP